MRKLVTIALLASSLLALHAEGESPDPDKDPAAFLAKVIENLQGETGQIELPGGSCEVNPKDGYVYLKPEKARFLLEELWGNPADEGVLGVILPPHFGFADESEKWAVVLSYEDSGHIDDKDAAGLNYGKLLSEMKRSAADANKDRKKAGYPTVELKGWAAEPSYDGAAHKMYWAKELLFEGETESTLNYFIRILGREGVLNLNVVASIADLPKVQAAAPLLLTMADFKPGQRYGDYVAGKDHLAEFGVAGLILGGVAAKAGLLKVLLGFLAAGWKFILAGLVAVGAFVKKFLNRPAKPQAAAVDREEDGEASS